MRTVLVLLSMALPVCAQPVEDAALKLAGRIARVAAPGSLQLAVENRSSLSAAYVDRVRAVLDRELKPSASGVQVTVTVSQSIAGPLLVAAIGSGDAAQAAIERFVADAPAGIVGAVELRPVLQQKVPILDFTFDGGTLFVLEPDRVVAGGKALPLNTPPSRDPRGRLIVREGVITAHLIGATCSGAAALVCGPPKTWRENGVEVTWNRNRLSADPYAPLRAGAPDADEIATVSAACGSLIAAGREGLQALQGGRPASPSVALPGPVTALWPSENSAELSVVVHNRTTGDYEASRASVRCP